MKWIKFILVFFIATIIGVLLYFSPIFRWQLPYYHMSYMMYGWMIGVGLLLGLGIIFGIVFFRTRTTSTTISYLESRLVRGEITIEEFKAIKQQITREVK